MHGRPSVAASFSLRPQDSLWDGAHDARLTGDVVDEILGGKVDRADWSVAPDDPRTGARPRHKSSLPYRAFCSSAGRMHVVDHSVAPSPLLPLSFDHACRICASGGGGSDCISSRILRGARCRGGRHSSRSSSMATRRVSPAGCATLCLSTRLYCAPAKIRAHRRSLYLKYPLPPW